MIDDVGIAAAVAVLDTHQVGAAQQLHDPIESRSPHRHVGVPRMTQDRDAGEWRGGTRL